MLHVAKSHLLAGLLHVASACALLALSAGYDGTRQLYLLRQVWRPLANQTDCSVYKCTVANELGEPYAFDLAAAAAFFGFWSGCLHLYAAYSVWDVSNDAANGDAQTQFELRRIRFFDYAVSSSVMVACVSIVLGSPSLGQVVTAVSAQFGVVAIFYFAQRANSAFFGFGVASVAYGVLWAPLFMVFMESMSGAEADPPSFVSFILIGVFFQFTSFAFLQLWLLCRPKTAYVLEESLFLCLSLSSKVLLHWVLFLAAISFNEITTEGTTAVGVEDTSQDVLGVVAGTLGGGLLLALGITYPSWYPWQPETLYG